MLLFSISFALLYLRCLCFLVTRTHNCVRLLIVAALVLKAAVKLTKVTSQDNNVCDVIIEHVIHVSADVQTKIYPYIIYTDRCRKRKAILGPVGQAQSVQTPGRNLCAFV